MLVVPPPPCPWHCDCIRSPCRVFALSLLLLICVIFYFSSVTAACCWVLVPMAVVVVVVWCWVRTYIMRMMQVRRQQRPRVLLAQQGG